MPTVPPYIANPDEDEDEGFSSGLTRDLRDTMVAAPDAPAPAPAPPPPAPVQVADDDAVGAGTPAAVTAPAYTAPDRTGLNTWESTLQKDQAPINRNDPAVKARWWERLAGGVGAGMMAAGGRGDALEAGKAVVNRRYNNAVADQQSRITADQTAIAAQKGIIAGSNEDFERGLQSFDAQGKAEQRNAHAAEFRAQEQQRLAGVVPGSWQAKDPNNPLTGGWIAKTVGGRVVEQPNPPDEWLKTPQGKLMAQTAERKKMLEDAGVKPGTDDYRYGMVNGKLEHPPKAPTTNVHMPSAESEEFAEYQRSLGRKATPEEIIAFRKGEPKSATTASATPEQIIKLHTDHDKAYQEMEDRYADLRSAEKDDAGRAKVDAAREAEKQKMDAQWGARFADARPGGWGRGTQPPPATATAPPSAPPAATAAAAPPPAPPPSRFALAR